MKILIVALLLAIGYAQTAGCVGDEAQNLDRCEDGFEVGVYFPCYSTRYPATQLSGYFSNGWQTSEGCAFECNERDDCEMYSFQFRDERADKVGHCVLFSHSAMTSGDIVEWGNHGSLKCVKKETCGDGDVWLEEIDAHTFPHMYYEGAFHPVIANFLWNNQYGYDRICKNLGFSSGRRGSQCQKLPKKSDGSNGDGIFLGECEEGVTDLLSDSCKANGFETPEIRHMPNKSWCAIACSGTSQIAPKSCGSPTSEPSGSPIIEPSGIPTIAPTDSPTNEPTDNCPSGYNQIGTMTGNNDIGGYGMAGASPRIINTVDECASICDESDECLSFTWGWGPSDVFDANGQGRCIWYNSGIPNRDDNRNVLFCARQPTMKPTDSPTSEPTDSPTMDGLVRGWPLDGQTFSGKWYKCNEDCNSGWLPSSVGGVIQTMPQNDLGLTWHEACAWWCNQEPECVSSWHRISGNHCSLYNFVLPFDANNHQSSHIYVKPTTAVATKNPTQRPTSSEPTPIPTSQPTVDPTEAPSQINSNPILREGDVCYRLVKEQTMCQKGWQATGGCNQNCDSVAKCAAHVNWGTPGFLVDRGNYNGRFCAQCESTAQIAGGNGNYDLYEYVDCPPPTTTPTIAPTGSPTTTPTIAPTGSPTNLWNFEDEHTEKFSTTLFTEDQAREFYAEGLTADRIDCDLEFRVQRDNSESRTKFSFMTLHDGRIFNIDMRGTRTNHQHWKMADDDCTKIMCYDYEQSQPRGKSGYCPGAFYDGTTPRELEFLLLKVEFDPYEKNQDQPERNRYTFKGNTYNVKSDECDVPEIGDFGGKLVDASSSSVEANGRIYLDFSYPSEIVSDFNISMDDPGFSYEQSGKSNDWNEDFDKCWDSINREFTYNQLSKAVKFDVKEGEVTFAIDASYEYERSKMLELRGEVREWTEIEKASKEIPFRMHLPETSSVALAIKSNQKDLSGSHSLQFRTREPTTSQPTREPTFAPTISEPTAFPTFTPPSEQPTTDPSLHPTSTQPSQRPSTPPSTRPSTTPVTTEPSMSPTVSEPTEAPSSSFPSAVPTDVPSPMPSWHPSNSPSSSPSMRPSEVPSMSPLPTSEILTTIMPYRAVETRHGQNPLIEIHFTTIIIRPWKLVQPVASGDAIVGGIEFTTLKEGSCDQFSELESILQDAELYCQTWALEFEGDRHCKSDSRQLSVAFNAVEPNGKQEALSMSWELDLGHSAAFECAIDLGTFEIALQVEGASGGNKNFDSPGEAFLDDWYYFRITASSGAPVTAISIADLDIQSASGEYLCQECQSLTELGIGISDWNPDNFVVHMKLDSSIFSGHLTATLSFSFLVNMNDEEKRRRLETEQQVVEQKVTLRLRSEEGRPVSATSPPTKLNPHGTSTELTVDDLVTEDTNKTESSTVNWRWILLGSMVASLIAGAGCYKFRCMSRAGKDPEMEDAWNFASAQP